MARDRKHSNERISASEQRSGGAPSRKGNRELRRGRPARPPVAGPASATPVHEESRTAPAKRSAPRPTARGLAAIILHRVCDDGAFAMRALDAELSRSGLSARDAGLCTEIVYGSLRVLPELDQVLQPRLKRGLQATDGLTLAVLRAAVYQLHHLSRVPTHAVVDEAVRFITATRSRQSGGFVNAVLRRVAEQRPENPVPPDRVTLTPWLAAVLRQSLGAERAELFCGPRPLPPLCLATRPGEREALLQQLRLARPDADFEPGRLSPHAIIVRGAGDPRELPGFAEGKFWVQEEGAQLVALAVDAQPGERIADLCAGHGGKSIMMAAQMSMVESEISGQLTAVDLDESKLERLPEELGRLGLAAGHGPIVDCVPVDLTVGTGGLAADFDRVLVDAPCTGLGTLHRRPELMLRVGKGDPLRMSELQIQIAMTGAQLVRPGGLLIVAVCSPTEEEGARVAKALEAQLPKFKSESVELDLPDCGADSDGILRIGPWMAPGDAFPDAYQVYQLRRGDN